MDLSTQAHAASKMKAIICGGREYQLTQGDARWLDGLHAEHKFTLVIEGGCRRKDYRGDDLPTADYGAYRWARSRGIQTATMDANWPLHNKAAGPLRNGEMAKLGEICIAFPGGRGTTDMCRQAKDRGLRVITR